MKYKHLRAGIWILVLISLASLVAFAAKEVKVIMTFEPRVEVSGERIDLGKIAKLTGDSSMIKQLKAIDLGPAPIPGGKFTLASTTIYSILQQYGVDPEEVKVANLGSEGILVTGAGQLVDFDRVMPKIKEYIYHQLPYSPQDIRIQQRSSTPNLWIPPGDYQVEVGPYRGSNLWGIVSLPVQIIQNGRETRHFSVNLEVQIFQQVYVSKMPIQRQSIIQADQVEIRYMDITRVHGEPAMANDEVIGKEAKRFFSAESILIKGYLQDQILIERNDQVTIQVSFGGVKIQTLGKALEDGAKGQWIWVENLSSGAEVQGVVVSDGVVQVKVN